LLNNQHISLFEKLSTVLKQNQGQCPVRLHYQVKQSRGFALLDITYFVTPNQQLILPLRLTLWKK
jgi:DNA polymerase-3 subunit alpha